MATHMHPPQFLYGSNNYASATADAYQTATGSSLYYPYSREPSTSSFAGARDAGAVTVVSNQDSTSHLVYADASAAVISYPLSYVAESGEPWVQAKPAHAQSLPLGSVRREAVFYESDGASPASDDSNPAFYDSPSSSEGSALADDYRHYNGAEQAYYSRAVTAPSADEFSGQGAYRADRRTASPAEGFDSGATHWHGGPQGQYEYSNNFPPAYFSEQSPIEDSYDGSQYYADASARNDYSQLSSPVEYAAAESYSPATAPLRSESPMAHLPYQGVEIRHRSTSHSPLYRNVSNQFGTGSVPQLLLPSPIQPPQPHYSLQHSIQQPTPISIPSRSPPLVEDTPKKPLTLACFFCRKRKIACGCPPPGATDRTCNQCARRKLQCVYPVGTRRSVRQRDVDTAPAATTHHPRATL